MRGREYGTIDMDRNSAFIYFLRLIELLERICFHQCSLQDQAMNSATIQNVMMKAAIRVNPRKVNEYVTRLD